jgi:hypothetical protein
MHYFCATCQSGHPEDRPKTQSILWKDTVTESQITAALEEEQIKKGNEKKTHQAVEGGGVSYWDTSILGFVFFV